jgi:hypothetical protein
MDNELVISTGKELAIMPVMDVEVALNRRQLILDFISKVMQPGIDYGVVPGISTPFLFKNGAIKLTMLFGLTKRFEILREVEDWSGEDHDHEPFFQYDYRCQLWRGDLLIAECDGSCNSREAKYRYRKAGRICPNCGQETIIKGKAQYGGGWLCWEKKGGCGAKYTNGDKAIEDQEVGRVLNPDIADVANTIRKMAQKRALTGATDLATNAGEFFSLREAPGLDEDDKPDEPERDSNPQPPKPTKNGNGNNQLDLFFDEVQALTNSYYKNKSHLFKAIGGSPNFNSIDDVEAKKSAAVDHALSKAE